MFVQLVNEASRTCAVDEGHEVDDLFLPAVAVVRNADLERLVAVAPAGEQANAGVAIRVWRKLIDGPCNHALLIWSTVNLLPSRLKCFRSAESSIGGPPIELVWVPIRPSPPIQSDTCEVVSLSVDDHESVEMTLILRRAIGAKLAPALEGLVDVFAGQELWQELG
jgi:hypothetical protein